MPNQVVQKNGFPNRCFKKKCDIASSRVLKPAGSSGKQVQKYLLMPSRASVSEIYMFRTERLPESWNLMNS